MKQIFKIEIEDIGTSKIGNNYHIAAISENIEIVFTSEAIEELYKDYLLMQKDAIPKAPKEELEKWDGEPPERDWFDSTKP